MRKVTIKDIAREAGVSTQTVSRATNDKGEISAQTRERILRIAERLGYRPNGVARSLATRRTQNIGLVVPDVSNPFFAGVARGIQDAADVAGYNVFLCNTDEDTARESKAIQSLEAQRVDGLILCSPRQSELELRGLADRYQPLVLVNRRTTHAKTGCVLVNDAEGTQAAVEYLVGLGHRSIGLLAGPELSHSGQERVKGYLRSMQAHDIGPSPSWRAYCAPQVEGGETATMHLLDTTTTLTALIAYNDLVAVGALRAAAALGRHVPGDLAIIGCDDVPLAALVSPALTTIHIPVYDIGRQAVSLLLTMMNQGSTAPTPIVLSPRLVVRDSTGVPSSAMQSVAERST